MPVFDNDQPIDVTKLKYVLYVRKSTDDEQRQVRSISDQIAECMAYAARQGLRIIGKPLTETKSAKRSRQRPIFRQMLEDIRKKKYDAVLAWHPDRLSRNMLEAGEIIDLVDEKIIKDLKFVNHTFTNDPGGKMMLGIFFVMSKQYSDDLSQKVTRGVRHSFAEGKAWTPKWGYVNENAVYMPDDHNFELIKEAWQLRKKRKSLEEIFQFLTEAGFYRSVKSSGKKIKVAPQALSRMFKDPFYYGVLVQAGQTVDLREAYDFVPAVSEEDWQTIQTSYQGGRVPYKVRGRTYYPLRQMVRCALCGHAMHVGASQGNIERYLYYRCDNKVCTRKKRSVRGKIIFNFIYDFLKDGLNFTEADYDRYYTDLERSAKERQQALQMDINSKQGAIKSIEKEMGGLSINILKQEDNKSAAVEAGNKQLKGMQSRAEQLAAELKDLKAKLIDPKQERISREQFLNLSKIAATKLKSADPIVKDRICHFIFLNFSIDDEKVASFTLKEPFKTLLAERKKGKFPTGGDERS